MSILIKQELSRRNIDKDYFYSIFDLDLFSDIQVKQFFKKYNKINELYKQLLEENDTGIISLNMLRNNVFMNREMNDSFQLLLISLKNIRNIAFEYKLSSLFFLKAEYVALYLKKGGFLYHTDISGKNALSYALKEKDIKKSKILIEHGLNVSTLDIVYNNFKDKKFVEMLIEESLINVKKFEISFGLLREKYRPENINILYEKGFDLRNVKPYFIKKDFVDTYIYYLNNGGNIKTLNNKGESVIKYLKEDAFIYFLNNTEYSRNITKKVNLLKVLISKKEYKNNDYELIEILLNKDNQLPEFILNPDISNDFKLKMLLFKKNLLKIDNLNIHLLKETVDTFKNNDIVLSLNSFVEMVKQGYLFNKKELHFVEDYLIKLSLDDLKKIEKINPFIYDIHSNTEINMTFLSCLENRPKLLEYLIQNEHDNLFISANREYKNKLIKTTDIIDGKLRSFSLLTYPICLVLNKNNLLAISNIINPAEIEESNKDVVEYLIKEGFIDIKNVNHVINEYIDFQSEGLKKYIELTGDYLNNFKDKNGESLLLYAQDTEQIKFLLKVGVNINPNHKIYSDQVVLMLELYFPKLIEDEQDILNEEIGITSKSIEKSKIKRL